MVFVNLQQPQQPQEPQQQRQDSVVSALEQQNIADSKSLVCVVGVGFVGEALLKEFGSVYDAIGLLQCYPHQ
ncbi:hypothetical protein BDV97DRAFT_356294 [Delphinella strobiligena]|nr:hypothetical protein BDV97DRAFT_356294 [Delphinella strobiligena]